MLLVQPGTYSYFTLDRGLTIIGYGACSVWGEILIAGIPAAETAVIVDVECSTLNIQGCSGHVIVQDMQQLGSCIVNSSPDVRFARVLTPYAVWSAAPQAALAVQGSRVELVSSGMRGQWGWDCSAPPVDGSRGIDCTSSRLHLAHSSAMGGSGSSCGLPSVFCGDGGIALDLHSGAEAILCGTPGDGFMGGEQGWNSSYSSDCSFDGDSGYSITLRAGSTLRRSAVTVWDTGYLSGHSCIQIQLPGIQNLGGVETLPPLIDPSLRVSGTPLPGSSVQFTLNGPVGAGVVLSFGRNAVVQPDPNTLIEVLTPPSRNVNLGTIPASGSVSFTWPIASVLLPGTRLFAQGRVTLSSGEVRRTNSVPVILR